MSELRNTGAAVTAAATDSPPESSVPNDQISIKGWSDQYGRIWAEFMKGKLSQLHLVGLLTAKPNEVFSSLADIGIAVVTDKTKRRIKDQVEYLSTWEATYIADHVGWHRGSWLLGDGEVISPNQTQSFKVVLDKSPKWGVAGTLSEWLREIAEPATGQSRFVCCLALAFVAPLLDIVGQKNFGLELTDDTSVGKWALLASAASVWGGAPRVTGFMETWATTLEGIEQTLMGHGDSILVLEEANLAEDDLRGKVLFRLAEGVQKVRFTHKGITETRRLVFLSSSNKSIAETLENSPRRIRRAAEARLFTVPACPSGKSGVFDRLPKRFRNSSQAVEHFEQAAAKYYGAPIRAFLKQLVRDRYKNEGRLRRRIQRLQRKFIRMTGVNPNDGAAHRKAKAFSLIYAAGELARRYGVLPERWKGIGKAVLSCYQAHVEATKSVAAASPRLAIDRMRDYFRDHRSDLVDITNGPIKMTDASFARSYGFVRRGDDGTVELLVPPKRLRSEFADWKPMMQELRDTKYARTEGGDQKKLTTKVAIRQGRSADRVYCIRIGTGA